MKIKPVSHRAGSYNVAEMAAAEGDHFDYFYTADWGHDKHPNIVLFLRGHWSRTRRDDPAERLEMSPGMTNGAWVFKQGHYRLVCEKGPGLAYCISHRGKIVPRHERKVLPKLEVLLLRAGQIAVIVQGTISLPSGTSFEQGEVLVAAADYTLMAATDAAIHVFN